MTTNDEGGFNEPSPEIKAKLKPAYTFDLPATDSQISDASKPILPTSDDIDDTESSQQHTLHYVDFGYRLNPDGSESKHCYRDEIETYAESKGNNGLHDVNIAKATNGFAVKQSVVYATIKTDVPPPPPPIDFDTDSISGDDERNGVDIAATADDDDDDDIDAKFEQIYHSPLNGDVKRSNANTLDSENSDQLFESLAKAQLPDAIPLDIQDVEYADASDKEDLPDAMTSYEADRLLSSRYVPTCRMLHLCEACLGCICV